MKFSKSVLPLGDGRVCHARAKNGVAELLCRVDGGIILKKAGLFPRAVKTGGVVCFADSCCFCGDGILEKHGNEFNVNFL